MNSLALKPLILGTAMSYTWDDLAPFIVSCRRHVPNATIVLFVSNLSLQTIAKLESENVKIIFDHFNKHHQFVGWRLALYQFRMAFAAMIVRFVTRNTLTSSISFVESLSSVVIQRFYRYLRYLETYGSVYTHILITDVRDVIFQANPFPCDGLHVFAEDESIGQSRFAMRWFQLSYGLNIWKSLSQRPLLNVGTTIGDSSSIIKYLTVMCSEYDRLMSFFWGADTSVHNFNIYNNLTNTVINDYGEGAVITLNAIKLENILVEDGILLNKDGLPYPVLHQSDRIAGLQLKAKNYVDSYM
jgi:hypothetical protein